MLAVTDAPVGDVFITGQTSAGVDGQTLITTWKFKGETGDPYPGWPRTWQPFAPPWIPPPGYKGQGVCVIPDGQGCYVAGFATAAGQGYDIVLIHYGENGNELSSTTWNYAPQNGDDYPVDMARDGGNGVWVGGVSTGAGTGADFVLIGFDATTLAVLGQGAAVARYNGANKTDTLAAISAYTVVAIQGLVGISVTGTSFAGSTGNDIVTINYVWNGATLSVVTPSPLVYSGLGGASDEVATSIATASHPGTVEVDVFVCGYSNMNPGRFNDYVILGYPNRGASNWHLTYPPLEQANPGDDFAYRITAQPGLDAVTRVVVTGTSWRGSSLNDIVTLAFSQAGAQQWPPSILSDSDSLQHPYDDRAVDMVASHGGHIYILGKRYQDKNGDGILDFDFLTISIDATTGDQRWLPPRPTYNAPNGGPDGPASIGYYFPGTDYSIPSIFVAGRSQGLFDSQPKYVTIKYVQQHQ